MPRLLLHLVALFLLVNTSRADAPAPPPAPPADAWFSRAWQTADGLPDNNVTGIVQSDDGYLWVGTKAGLMRFNGVEFTELSLASLPALTSRSVRALFHDRRDRLWLALEHGPVVCVERSQLRVFTPADGLIPLRAITMTEDPDGGILITYPRGLRRIFEGRVSTIELPEMGKTSTELMVASGPDGKLWCAYGHRLGLLQNGVFVPSINLGPREIITAIRPNSSGGLWLSTRTHLLSYTAGSPPQPLSPFPEKTLPTFLLEDRHGTLWCGTAKGGLFRLNSNRLQNVPTSHNDINCLHEDRDGNLWVGTAGGGLNLVQPQAVKFIGRAEGLPFDSTQSVCTDTAGALWVVSREGGLARFQDGAWELINTRLDAHNAYATCVTADPRAGVWVGTRNDGLRYFHDGQWQPSPKPGLPSNQGVRSAWAAQNGDVWVAVQNPVGLFRLRDNILTHLRTPAGLGLIRAIAENAQGAIWIGTATGQVLRVQDDSLIAEPLVPQNSGSSVRTLLATPDGSLWIGFAGDGLGRLRNGRYDKITTDQGLIDNYVSQLIADDFGSLWIVSNRGCSRVSLEEIAAVMAGQSPRVYPRVFGRSDGLPSLQPSRDNCPTATRASAEQLYFATNSGLLRINPARINPPAEAPDVIIESIHIDDRPAAPGPRAPDRPLLLPPDHRALEIAYTAFAYASPENIHFRHRLLGYDDHWTDDVTRRRVTYARLPAGTYHLQIIASVNTGSWTALPTVLTITVAPFYWETWWFKFAIGLLTALTVGGIVFIVVRRRYRKKIQRLEAKRALDQERARIARDIHDDLGANLTGITLLSQPLPAESNPAEAAAKLQQINTTARQLTRSIEQVVWAINPALDTFDGLANFFGNYAQNFLRLANIRCRLEFPLQTPDHPLSAEVRHNLFLAYKEALNNAVKYARATEIRIALAFHPTRWELSVEDNGLGLSATPTSAPDRLAPPNGLANMQRRLQDIGGACAFLPASPTGTRVVFTLSLEKPYNLLT